VSSDCLPFSTSKKSLSKPEKSSSDNSGFTEVTSCVKRPLLMFGIATPLSVRFSHSRLGGTIRVLPIPAPRRLVHSAIEGSEDTSGEETNTLAIQASEVSLAVELPAFRSPRP